MPQSPIVSAACPDPARRPGRPRCCRPSARPAPHAHTPRPPASEGQPRRECRASDGREAGGRSHHHNAESLVAYGQSRGLGLRNRLVTANLALVRQIARREARRCPLPFDDLLQEGSIGLIRAVEAYDHGRGGALSSVAVPYVRGRIRQHVRDRGCLLRGCRGLRELHHRGLRLQQERLHRGLPPLGEPALAAALGCREERWREALGQARAQQLRSLDHPAGGTGAELEAFSPTSPVEGLVDPRSQHDPYAFLQAQEQRQLLRQRLDTLPPDERMLLLARVLEQRSWRELGRWFGISARVAQRRFERLVVRLQSDLASLRTA